MPYQVELPEQPTAHQLRSAMLGAAEYLHGLRQMPEGERSPESYDGDVRSAVDFIYNYDPIIRAFELGSTPAPATTGPRGATQPADQENRSFGERVTGDSQYEAFVKRGGAGDSGFVEVNIPGSLVYEQRATITTGTTGVGGGGFVPQAPLAIPPRVREMQFFLRDLLFVQGTGLTAIPYIREVNAAGYLEYAASAVAENSAKPEVDMQWELDEAVVRKIAAWIPVTSEIIDDAPTLRGYIDNRLAYMLMVREQYEILNGSGTAPHLKGILQYSVQTQAAVTGDPAATIGRAIGKVENVDGAADGVAMNPVDYWTTLTTRFANQFDGGNVGTGASALPFTTGPATLWGLPVVRTRALASGSAIVGSWRLGATLFDRADTTIRVGNQHSDFFTNNKVAILAEERVALAVHRPDFFVNTTLTFS